MIEGLFELTNYQTAKKLMDLAELQQRIAASNIANVNTPGFTRLKVAPTFEAELRQAVGAGDIGAIKQLQPRVEEDHFSPSVRPDGNNVSLDRELTSLSENAIKHEYLIRVLNGQYSSLRHAITGQAR